jgi:RNA polymerase sigma factor (TIGR02999 family)
VCQLPTEELRKTERETVMPDRVFRTGGPGDRDQKASAEERRALDDLFSLVYEELRRLASIVRQREPNITLNSTALVHEAWIKLKGSPHLATISIPHFKAIAAKAMRQVLVDEARRRHSMKRGSEAILVTLDEGAEQIASCDAELLALEVALDQLAQMNARQAQLVECRFFGGLNVAETAELLSVSESSIERDWRAAKAWLASAIRPVPSR